VRSQRAQQLFAHKPFSFQDWGMFVDSLSDKPDIPDPMSIQIYDVGQQHPEGEYQEFFWATTVGLGEERMGRRWRPHGPLGHLATPMWSASNRVLFAYAHDPTDLMRFNRAERVAKIDIGRQGEWWIALREFLVWLETHNPDFAIYPERTGSDVEWIHIWEERGSGKSDPYTTIDLFTDEDDEEVTGELGTVSMIYTPQGWPGVDYFYHNDCSPGDCYPGDRPDLNLSWPTPEYVSRNNEYAFFVDDNPWLHVGV
jgi:hypothetical protein